MAVCDRLFQRLPLTALYDHNLSSISKVKTFVGQMFISTIG